MKITTVSCCIDKSYANNYITEQQQQQQQQQQRKKIVHNTKRTGLYDVHVDHLTCFTYCKLTCWAPDKISKEGREMWPDPTTVEGALFTLITRHGTTDTTGNTTQQNRAGQGRAQINDTDWIETVKWTHHMDSAYRQCFLCFGRAVDKHEILKFNLAHITCSLWTRSITHVVFSHCQLLSRTVG